MKSLCFAVVAYRYAVEVSPVVKNICLYLTSRGHSVDLVVDQWLRDQDFGLPGVRLVKLGLPWYYNLALRTRALRRFRRVRNLGTPLFAHRLKSIIPRYDWVLCVEIWSLGTVARTNFDLSKAIYLSLESVQTLSGFTRNIGRPKRLLSNCAFCIIQSPERGKDFAEHLGMTVDFEYLPVSLRPTESSNDSGQKQVDSTGPVCLVYSGYFADWACLTEFIDAYKQLRPAKEYRLFLQGHHIGTDRYLETVRSKIAQVEHVTLDTSFYRDNQHLQFLAQFDIGLAFYRGPSGNVNWDNLIFSSGKIASYLWAGLPILTNIDHAHTKKPPFLYVDSISTQAVRAVIDQYRLQRQAYHTAAREHARLYYNTDTYLDKIMLRLTV